jgi:hypothetical protein
MCHGGVGKLSSDCVASASGRFRNGGAPLCNMSLTLLAPIPVMARLRTALRFDFDFFLTGEFSYGYSLCRELKAVRQTFIPRPSAHDAQAINPGLLHACFDNPAPTVITVD